MMTIQTSAPAAATNANPAPAANGPDAALLALTPGEAGAPPADDPAAAALPALFAQLLNQAGLAVPADPALADALAAADAGAADADAPADSDTAAAPAAPVATAPADAGAALPAMVSSLLAIAVPPLAAALAAPAPAPAATGSSTAASDDSGSTRIAATAALNTSAVLNNASTRLNLAAAGVAVTPAAPAAAPATAAAGYAATAAAQPAAAPAPELTPAPSPTPAASLAAASSSQAASAAGAVAANAAAATSAAVANAVPPGARSAARADDNASSGNQAGTGSASAASAVPLGASKDDTLAAATRVTAAPTPSAVNGSYAQTAQQLQNGAAVKLNGTPEQWQQPLREALGDRLQLQLQRNDNQAVIRLDPPNMGRIEISIRHSAGTLQVNLSASNSEVLRQLNSIGDSVRQDLSQRQFNDVAVTVSAARAGQGQADADGRSRQQRDADEGRTPGRALSDDGSAAASFAMLTDRE